MLLLLLPMFNDSYIWKWNDFKQWIIVMGTVQTGRRVAGCKLFFVFFSNCFKTLTDFCLFWRFLDFKFLFKFFLLMCHASYIWKWNDLKQWIKAMGTVQTGRRGCRLKPSFLFFSKCFQNPDWFLSILKVSWFWFIYFFLPMFNDSYVWNWNDFKQWKIVMGTVQTLVPFGKLWTV